MEYLDGEEVLAKDLTAINNFSSKGYFNGRIKMKGGWYRLMLRASKNADVVYEKQIEKVGIGEVFVISGQSNAQGVPNSNSTGAKDDRVNCANF